MRNLIAAMLVAVAVFEAYELKLRPKTAWPDYAAPMPACGVALGKIYESSSLRFQYPAGWKVTSKADRAAGVDELFVAPDGGKAGQVILILHEGGAGGIGQLAGGGPAAAAKRPAEGSWVPGTNKTFDLDGKRQAYGYLGRKAPSDGAASDSWMLFLWDQQSRMVAVSGPQLADTFWPQERTDNARLNCAFWSVIKTLTPK